MSMAITKKNRLNTIEYHVERWDETVFLRELTANQLSKIGKMYVSEDGGEVDQVKIMTEMLYMSLVDENGMKLMSKKELGNISGTVFLELATKAGELNNVTGEATPTKEDLLKNV